MKLPVTPDLDDNGGFVGSCPAIPGCASQGRTEEEALASIREAIQLCIEVRKEEGLPPDHRDTGGRGPAGCLDSIAFPGRRQFERSIGQAVRA